MERKPCRLGPGTVLRCRVPAWQEQAPASPVDVLKGKALDETHAGKPRRATAASLSRAYQPRSAQGGLRQGPGPGPGPSSHGGPAGWDEASSHCDRPPPPVCNEGELLPFFGARREPSSNSDAVHMGRGAPAWPHGLLTCQARCFAECLSPVCQRKCCCCPAKVKIGSQRERAALGL